MLIVIDRSRPRLCGRITIGVVLACLALSAPGGLAGGAPRPATCRGSLRTPGILAGTYSHGVIVKGVCRVSAGPAHVDHGLVLRPRSILLADYGLNQRTHAAGSELTVSGDVTVERHATFVMGCSSADAPCLDQTRPDQALSGSGRISGSLIARGALAVIVHNSAVGGAVRQTGGGGGLSCDKPGAFKLLKYPVYSSYEDTRVGRGLRVTRLRSCYLAVARVQVNRDLILTHDHLVDQDAIEVLANRVGRNLKCSRDSHVWDSSEATHTGLYPRKAEPNHVAGRRSGQCRFASPARQGAPAGPGAF